MVRKMEGASKYQQAIYKTFLLTKKNISISAVAGSGKTTTLLELLNYIHVNCSSLFLAFNNSIVDELRKRNSKEGVNIMTIHSCGWRMLLRTYGSKIKMDENKSIGKTEQVIKKLNLPVQRTGYYFYIIPKIIDLMRCNLCENTQEGIQALVDRYNIDIEENDYKAIMLAFKYHTADKNRFDFTDMIYVPVVDKAVRFTKYDFVFCDESQDFSLCQQAFIKNCLNRKGRLVTVGDPNQAIYGFAGADAESYENLANLNGKAIKLPLSVSYRCAKNIVVEARKIVPEINYAPDSPYGVVEEGSLTTISQGDWVLCRNLKPLIQTYIWLMRNKVKSKIKGKDIGEGIIALIVKTGACSIPALTDGLERERTLLYDKLEKRGVRKPDLHPKMELIDQRIEVINCLLDKVNSVKELLSLIDKIFADDIKGIMLSTIHKAKGLENDKVYFLAPELIPSRYATQDWEFVQESNLKYVAITRAKKELIYVSGDTFKVDLCANVKV